MIKSQSKPSMLWLFLAFAAIYIIWGSAYVCNKILVTELPPFFLAGVRFITAAMIIFAIYACSGRHVSITSSQLANAVFSGFLFITLGNGCLVYGLQYVDSGFAALLVASEPLIILLLLLGIKGQPIGLKSIIGVVLGMIGIYLLIAQDGIAFDGHSWKGLIGIAISLVGWGYASIFVGDSNLPNNHFLNSGIQMLSGGLILLLISITTETHLKSPLEASKEAWLSMGYLIVFASIITFTAFNYLLKHVSPEKVATSNYVNPLVAMILGWWLLDETVSGMSGIAACFLLVGVYFVNSEKGKSK